MAHRGTNHFKETDDVPPLNEQQAREQLKYNLRNQLGRLTFRTEPAPEYQNYDGVVIAEINGGEVDHYLFANNSDGGSE